MDLLPEYIHCDFIRTPAYPDRKEINMESLDNLVDSISRYGLLHPISIKPLDDKYELIAGHRRLLSVMTLGWHTILCNIYHDITAADVCVLRATENLQRTALSPMEEAYSVIRLANNHGFTTSQISSLLGRSPGWCSRRMKLCEITESLRESVHIKKLSISHALALNDIRDDDTREYMHGLCVNDGATLPVLLRWIDEYNHDCTNEMPADPDEALHPTIEPTAPKVMPCTICGEQAELGRMAWRPICETCMEAAEQPA